jgi:NAD(P)-dependent dehydrogenase (short-subunit alcohol dehydrogenase family)
LDVLVNNAGCPTKPGIDQNSLETFDFVFEVNVRAVYRLIQIAVPHLEKTKGSIVNLSSGLSQKPSPLMIPYSITKAAINHLTRNFASALASKGIRVNAVAPGIVSTEFHDRSGMGGNHVLDVAKNIVPLNRAGRPEEQAQLILNIAAPDNSYMTGSIIFNDGGLIL